MSHHLRLPALAINLLLVVLSPVLLVGLSEVVIALTGIETDVARDENARIGLPVWLLADESWVADRQLRMRRSGVQTIEASEVDWLHHFEEARWIQYKMKPDVDVEAVNPFNEIERDKGVTFRLSSNSDGFRERDFEPKQPGVVRIVTIGDSSTFGWGAEPEHTFQRLLEGKLDNWQPGRFEVLNLGIPGHNSRHGIGMLEHYALPLDPDIVLISYGANDPRMVPTPTDELLSVDDTWLGAARFAALRLRTYRLLRRLRFQLASPLDAEPGTGGQQPTVEAVSIDAYRENLFALVRSTRAHGAAPLVMSVCTANRIYAATSRDVAASEDVPFLDVAYLFDDAIEALAAGDLYPERVDRYRRLYGQRELDGIRSRYVASDGCHPHWVGHSLIADRMFDLVRQTLGQPVLPDDPPGVVQ
jgi:lysophospholipase L1-like esterase